MNLEERIEKIVELFIKALVLAKESFSVKVASPAVILRY